MDDATFDYYHKLYPGHLPSAPSLPKTGNATHEWVDATHNRSVYASGWSYAGAIVDWLARRMVYTSG